jgi:hypothetical protein
VRAIFSPASATEASGSAATTEMENTKADQRTSGSVDIGLVVADSAESGLDSWSLGEVVAERPQ